MPVWDLSAETFDSGNELDLALASPTAGEHGIAVKPDGMRLWTAGGSSVVQFNLSTAWDLTTGSYSTAFSTASQASSLADLAFSSDGTKMYVVSVSSDTVYQYTLSTAWDLSTTSYASKSFYVGDQDGDPRGLAFSSDGTKLYVAGNNNNRVWQYALSTAWDVSTASYSTVSAAFLIGSGPQALAFKSDGTRMFVVDTDTSIVNGFSLSTAWDVSTASAAYGSTGTGGTSPGELFPVSIAFSPDGVYMFVAGTTKRKVLRWTLGVAPSASKLVVGYMSLSNN